MTGGTGTEGPAPPPMTGGSGLGQGTGREDPAPPPMTGGTGTEEPASLPTIGNSLELQIS